MTGVWLAALYRAILLGLGSSSFQVNFWSNLIADIIAGLAFLIVLNRVTDWFKSPVLRMVVKQDGFYRDTIVLSAREDGDYEATFVLSIKNEGNHILRADEGYWHAYMYANNVFSANGEKNHQRDLIKAPVLPGYFLDITSEYKLLVHKEDIKSASIPYFFATTYGYFPRSTKMEQQSGFTAFESMGKVKCEA
jgi:hypothetical protein